jgi:4'-phosphopantetheinyl transferase
LRLSEADVHVWRASLAQPAWRVRQLAHTLSSDERARAERFHFERDRHHFIVGRGLLRVILSRYLGSEPQHLAFCYGAHGKPALVPPSAEETLRFNLSHAHGLVLYGVARTREIGLDLERIRPIPEAEQIAERFFSAQEHAILRALPASQKAEAFFNGWTRKEAYIKALGDGLTKPLDQFDVSLVPGEPARLLRVEGDAQEVARWGLQSFVPAGGYVAALAVEGQGWHVTYWEWVDECGDEERCELTRGPEG